MGRITDYWFEWSVFVTEHVYLYVCIYIYICIICLRTYVYITDDTRDYKSVHIVCFEINIYYSCFYVSTTEFQVRCRITYIRSARFKHSYEISLSFFCVVVVGLWMYIFVCAWTRRDIFQCVSREWLNT